MKKLSALFLFCTLTASAQFAVTFPFATNATIQAYELYEFPSSDMADTNNIGHWVAWCPATNNVIPIANWVKEGSWLTVRSCVGIKHGTNCPPILFQPSLFDVVSTNTPVADTNFDGTLDAPAKMNVIKL